MKTRKKLKPSCTLQKFRSSADRKTVTLKVNQEDNTILWRHILKSFGDVAKIRVNDTDIHFKVDGNYEDLLPLRIEACVDSTIDVILSKDLTQKNKKLANLSPKYNEELRHKERVHSIVLPFTYHINQPGDEYVRFGSRISLRHVHTGSYLRSVNWISKTSSEQHAVQGVRSGVPGLEDFWQVVPLNGDDDSIEINQKAGETIRYGVRIRLFNVANKRWLHSFDPKSSVPTKHEVTTFGCKNRTDRNDIWIVERLENGTEYWKSSDIFVLRHEHSGFRSSLDGKITTLKVGGWDDSILWKHILRSFGDVAKVCIDGTDIHFEVDENNEDLIPLRIEGCFHSIIDVILFKDMSDKGNKIVDLPPKYKEEHRNTEKIHSMVLPFTCHINRPEDEYVRFGSRISLRHVQTGSYLQSVNWKYKSPSNQHAVQGVRSGELGLEDFWQVVPLGLNNVEINQNIGVTIRYGVRVRLFSVSNKRWLHTHNCKAPVSSHREVTTYGSGSNSNVDDIWIVERLENGTEYWKSSDIFLLRHLNTDHYLHSHSTKYMGENEITSIDINCFVNSLWRAGFA
ncbi:hypothetical protein BGZ76_002319 [Entomortierella beljakovae]|nr:hypothetical protein BGZ76_002319 [Entomortierella beljakovae]